LWDKRPAYGGYPKSDISDLEDWNTTPGPSCPAGNNRDTCHENDKNDNRNHSSETHRPKSRGLDNHRGHDPSDPSDSSSSGSMYNPRTHTTTTDTETSPDEDTDTSRN
jgi:hypothetical protein